MPSPERPGRYHHHRPPSHPDQGGSSQPDIFIRLEQAIGAIQDSDSFRRYLDAQSRFHTYSFGNVVLILTQRPTSTRVAGYSTWLSLHRQVRRGEKGIRIIVPMRRKANEEDTTAEESGLFFGTGTVFDIDQTDGEPLPEVTVPTLAGESGGKLMDALLELAVREDVAVTLDRGQLPSAAMGAYWSGERRIRFRAAPMRQMVKTLAHELGHHVHLSRFGKESLVQAERETVAESVAYVVCGKYGIDTGERSFNYIATWAQDGQTLRNAMGTIQKVSAAIIDGIDGSGAIAPVLVRTP